MLKKLGTHHWFLLVILVIAAALRFYTYPEVSYSNDELSALNRVQYDSYGEMLKEGITPDGHPAGVQTFLYFWTKLFGFSEAAVRFPFIIAGLLSVLLSYLIASRWFGIAAGLLSASAIACLEFPLLYSQIARPYMPGMMVSLSTAWFWTLVLFGERKDSLLEGKVPKWVMVVGLAVSAAAGMYTHYFSFLFVGMVLVSGILFLDNENYRRYFLALGITFVLFSPHIGLTLHQFTNVGEIGNWLAAPTPQWVIDHFFYIFNGSVFVILLIALLFGLSFAINFKEVSFNSFHVVSLVWFAVPFAVGYLFSIIKAPLLQNSVLIFSFPFLIFFCFSFFTTGLSKLSKAAIFVFVPVLLYSTVIENKYFTTNHLGDVKQIAVKAAEWADKFGKGNITYTTNVNAAYYTDYYLEKYGVSDLDFKIYKLDLDTTLRVLADIVMESNTDYFMTGWSTKAHPAEVELIIREKYPYAVEEASFLNTGVYLYTRLPQQGKKRNTVAEFATSFKKWTEEWHISEERIKASEETNQSVFEMSAETEYGPTIEVRARQMRNARKLWVSLEGVVENTGELQLVVDLSHAGENYFWKNMKFEHFLKSGQEGKVFFCVDLPTFKSEDDVLKVYPWNPSKEKMLISKMRCEFY